MNADHPRGSLASTGLSTRVSRPKHLCTRSVDEQSSVLSGQHGHLGGYD